LKQTSNCFVDETIKDVTKKYASDWSSLSWKLRDDDAWWQQVILPFQPKSSPKDENEDQHIEGFIVLFLAVNTL